jgi:hypothetical protein
MKARLIIDDKTVFDDGSIIQVRIWAVPEAVPPSEHGYKYSLFFGRAGERLVGFDNERGKGDHCHIRGIEKPYRFVSITQLLQDFRRETEAVKGSSL